MIKNNRKIIKEFLNFLKINNAIKSYRINSITFLGQKETITKEEIALQPFSNKLFKNPLDLIDYAFVWEDTKEGHQYWSCLNSQWLKTFTE